MNEIRIAASILACDASEIGEEMRRAHAWGADVVHVDVMDGHFVPNLSYGPAVVASLRKNTDMVIDVHLMVERPAALIAPFVDAGADIISVHPEADAHPHRLLQEIRKRGKLAGAVLNPGTHESALTYLMDEVDLILLMTVNPGFGGQAFIPAVLPKIAAVRAMINSTGRDIALEVDGGIGDATASLVTAAGANLLVTGSALFGAADPAASVKRWKSRL